MPVTLLVNGNQRVCSECRARRGSSTNSEPGHVEEGGLRGHREQALARPIDVRERLGQRLIGQPSSRSNGAWTAAASSGRRRWAASA